MWQHCFCCVLILLLNCFFCMVKRIIPSIIQIDVLIYSQFIYFEFLLFTYCPCTPRSMKMMMIINYQMIWYSCLSRCPIHYMSRVIRKLDFCICENKDADQLREAEQRLCFRYTDSTIPLLHKSEISSL